MRTITVLAVWGLQVMINFKKIEMFLIGQKKKCLCVKRKKVIFRELVDQIENECK